MIVQFAPRTSFLPPSPSHRHSIKQEKNPSVAYQSSFLLIGSSWLAKYQRARQPSFVCFSLMWED